MLSCSAECETITCFGISHFAGGRDLTLPSYDRDDGYAGRSRLEDEREYGLEGIHCFWQCMQRLLIEVTDIESNLLLGVELGPCGCFAIRQQAETQRHQSEQFIALKHLILLLP